MRIWWSTSTVLDFPALPPCPLLMRCWGSGLYVPLMNNVAPDSIDHGSIFRSVLSKTFPRISQDPLLYGTGALACEAGVFGFCWATARSSRRLRSVPSWRPVGFSGAAGSARPGREVERLARVCAQLSRHGRALLAFAKLRIVCVALLKLAAVGCSSFAPNGLGTEAWCRWVTTKRSRAFAAAAGSTSSWRRGGRREAAHVDSLRSSEVVFPVSGFDLTWPGLRVLSLNIP